MCTMGKWQRQLRQLSASSPPSPSTPFISASASLASDSVSYHLQAVLNDAQCPRRPQPALRHRDANGDSASVKLQSAKIVCQHQVRTASPSFAKIGERAFSYSGHASWNSLPSHITSIMDTPTFRARLKKHFFRLAYDL